jgi:hypothetical protein
VLNHHILPALKFSPKELLLGIAINTPRTEPEEAAVEPSTGKATIHIAYTVQQHLDSYEATVKHAITRKQAFNKQVLKGSGEVSFKKGNLVQIYQSDLDYTFKTGERWYQGGHSHTKSRNESKMHIDWSGWMEQPLTGSSVQEGCMHSFQEGEANWRKTRESGRSSTMRRRNQRRNQEETWCGHHFSQEGSMEWGMEDQRARRKQRQQKQCNNQYNN